MTRGKRARLMTVFLSTGVRNAGVLLFLLCPKANTDGKDSTISATILQAAVTYSGPKQAPWLGEVKTHTQPDPSALPVQRVR